MPNRVRPQDFEKCGKSNWALQNTCNMKLSHHYSSLIWHNQYVCPTVQRDISHLTISRHRVEARNCIHRSFGLFRQRFRIRNSWTNHDIYTAFPPRRKVAAWLKRGAFHSWEPMKHSEMTFIFLGLKKLLVFTENIHVTHTHTHTHVYSHTHTIHLSWFLAEKSIWKKNRCIWFRCFIIFPSKVHSI